MSHCSIAQWNSFGYRLALHHGLFAHFPANNTNNINSFFPYFSSKHIMWVLKRTASLSQFFEHPKRIFRLMSKLVRNSKHFPLGAFCNNFDLHLAIIGLENQMLVFLEWLFYTGFTFCLSGYMHDVAYL